MPKKIKVESLGDADLVANLINVLRRNPGKDVHVMASELRRRLSANETTPLKPSPQILIKLGSIAVHIEELLSPHGHEFDKVALDGLLKDPQIVEWISQMNRMAFLPVKRNL